MRTLLIYLLLLCPALAWAQPSFELQEGYPVEVFINTPVQGTLMPEGETGPFMYFKLYSVSYPQELGYDQAKVSIKISGGDWVDVTNENAVCPGREARYECVEGPLATVRFAIQTVKLGNVAQSDSIFYRFNYVAGDASSGFRVLAASKTLFDELLSVNTVPVDTTGEDDDPPPPPPPVEEVLSGEELFAKRDHLIDFPGGPPITAGCADCHALDGRDLKYFGFTEASIASRSLFHGLSEEEASAIAEYVYELEFEPVGTPWDPPYQPGPKADRSNPFTWAAGSGLEAVLEADSLFMIPIEWIDLDGRVNRQITPVTMQLPDWNEWLPVFHPVEAWNGDFWQSDVYQEYLRLRANLETPGYVEQAIANGSLVRDFDSWADAVKDAEREDSTFVGFDRVGRAKRDLSLYQWHTMKTWELMHTFDLEHRSVDMYPAGDSLSWFSTSRAIFNLGPHIHGESKGPNGTIYNTYFDTGWYQTAYTVNTGNSSTLAIKPFVRRYHYNHIRDMGKVTLEPNPQRYLLTYLEALQTAGRIGPSEVKPLHVWINVIGPLSQEGCGKNPFCQMPMEERQMYANAFLGEFLKFIERYPVEAWDGVLEPSDLIPVCEGELYLEKNWANATLCMTREWDGFADPALIERLTNWGAERWPGGEW